MVVCIGRYFGGTGGRAVFPHCHFFSAILRRCCFVVIVDYAAVAVAVAVILRLVSFSSPLLQFVSSE